MLMQLGPQHVRNGRVRFRQAKNEHRNLIDIDITLHPELEAKHCSDALGTPNFLSDRVWSSFHSGGIW